MYKGLQTQQLKVPLKVARYSFSGSIPPKFEHKLRRHKQKIATTVVLDKDYDQGCNDIGVVLATK